MVGVQKESGTIRDRNIDLFYSGPYCKDTYMKNPWFEPASSKTLEHLVKPVTRRLFVLVL